MSVNNRDITVSLYISDYFEPTNGHIVCMELLREKDSCHDESGMGKITPTDNCLQ